MTDLGPPRLAADERTTLVAFYEYLRERLLAKLDGLDDASARRPGVDSGTSLLGLAKHVTGVESWWITTVLAGRDDGLDDDELRDDDTIESVRALAAEVAAKTSAILADVDLDAEIANTKPWTHPLVPNNRWVLVHMIEEVGRHAGHADIIREQLDGSVGR